MKKSTDNEAPHPGAPKPGGKRKNRQNAHIFQGEYSDVNQSVSQSV